MGIALQRLAQEDPTFRVYSPNPDTGQTLISGMGELHPRNHCIVDRMLREYSVQANVGRLQVAYRETIRKKASGEGKSTSSYDRRGSGQYGHCKDRVASPSEFQP